MVDTAGRGANHSVDQVAAFLREDLAKAVLLRLELLVERRLRHPRACHDIVDRRVVIATRGEHAQRGLGQPRTPLQTSRLARIKNV